MNKPKYFGIDAVEIDPVRVGDTMGVDAEVRCQTI